MPLAGFCQLIGEVVSIADGDTFTLLTADKRQVKIRLHGIDAPESKQAFGQVSKQFLAGLVFKKKVYIKDNGQDRYGRTIGIVYLTSAMEAPSVNEELLKSGLAWHYKKYDQNAEWAKLEQVARDGKKGLWKDASPMAPWDFRHQ